VNAKQRAYLHDLGIVAIWGIGVSLTLLGISRFRVESVNTVRDLMATLGEVATGAHLVDIEINEGPRLYTERSRHSTLWMTFEYVSEKEES
jgi:hypothetical protein